MPRLSFQPLGDSWTLVAVLLAALVVGLVVFRPNDATLSRFRRRVAFGLRLALVAIFAVLFARPSVVSVEKEELPASFVFLCDLSESMSIRDEADGASRFDAMKAGFASVQDRLRALSERFDVRVFGFGDSTEELELVDGAVRFPDAPTGSETPLGDALAETLRTTAGSRTLGVAVISDGTQRTKDAESPSPQDVALRWRDAERPIFAVPLGSAEGSPTTRDVAVLDLRSNDRVFLGNELTVSGQVRVLGLAGQKIPLALSLETSPGKLEIVDSTALTPTSNDATLSYRFVCAPKTAGQWKLRVAATPQDGELADSNNELGAFVAAIDGGLDVLYIEGTRRYEQNFLRAALDEASDVRVRYWRPSTASLVARLPDATEAQRVAALTRSRKSLIETF
ncbi:MAG: VWA domain-containing protein, partial [Thermoguttaceae bacterium]|nr:VWA domain-containing protein [Thermoguttaceae bacterium]